MILGQKNKQQQLGQVEEVGNCRKVSGPYQHHHKPILAEMNRNYSDRLKQQLHSYLLMVVVSVGCRIRLIDW